MKAAILILGVAVIGFAFFARRKQVESRGFAELFFGPTGAPNPNVFDLPLTFRKESLAQLVTFRSKG